MKFLQILLTSIYKMPSLSSLSPLFPNLLDSPLLKSLEMQQVCYQRSWSLMLRQEGLTFIQAREQEEQNQSMLKYTFMSQAKTILNTHFPNQSFNCIMRVNSQFQIRTTTSKHKKVNVALLKITS